MSLEEPFGDYESFDTLEWVEGSKYALLRQWPTYYADTWCSDYSSHDIHAFAGKGFFPISTHIERYGFLWLWARKVWTFRRIVLVRRLGVLGGPSTTFRLTPPIDLEG